MEQNIQSAPQTPTPQVQPVHQSSHHSVWKTVLLMIVVAIFSAYGGYYVANHPIQLSPRRGCTMEAKVCPDGSSVGRIGPNCEFAPCPTATANPTADWKTYINEKYGFLLKYPEKWTEKVPSGITDPTLVYIYSDEKIGTGTEPLQYYLWITGVSKLPDRQYSKELINNYTAYKTTSEPSRSGALGYYITKDESQYIGIFLTPYNDVEGFTFPSQDTYVTTYNQILSTFKFAENERASNLPTGWSYYKDAMCNVDLPTPPAKTDTDNRVWQTGTNSNYDFMGFFKGKSVFEIHRNPTEASGFVSGFVEVGCGPNTGQNSLEKLSTDFHAHLTLQTPQNTAPETLIELTSNKDVTMWGMPAKEMAFVGGMFDPKQKYYLIANSVNWYLITKKSHSSSLEINQQTNQIFDLLKFTQ